MFISGMTVWGLTYFLPKALGVPVEFFHLEFIPMALNFTVCVVGTARFMKFCANRDRLREREQYDDPVRTAARRDSSSSNEDEDDLDNNGAGFAQEFIVQLNTIVLSCVILGCEFCGVSACTPISLYSLTFHTLSVQIQS